MGAGGAVFIRFFWYAGRAFHHRHASAHGATDAFNWGDLSDEDATSAAPFSRPDVDRLSNRRYPKLPTIWESRPEAPAAACWAATKPASSFTSQSELAWFWTYSVAAKT